MPRTQAYACVQWCFGLVAVVAVLAAANNIDSMEEIPVDRESDGMRSVSHQPHRQPHEPNRRTSSLNVTEEVESLRSNFLGGLFLPSDEGYDEARILWNAKYDRWPSLIAQCAGVADVMAAVSVASAHGRGAAVRSGFHDLSGQCLIDEEISIDMSQMQGVYVDRERLTVRAEAGTPWRKVTREVQAFGFATGGSMASSVTVSGYGLGGGVNLFMRAYGLACDNIVSIEVVTADGQLRTVDETTHEDLFWAMRGAGANFGVVVEYRLYPLTTFLAGSILWALGDDPHAEASKILHFLRDYNLNVPDEVTTFAYLLSDAALGPVIQVWACYAGDVAEGTEVLRELREFGTPIADDVVEVTCEEQQTRVDFVAPAGRYYYYRTQLLQTLDNNTLDALIDQYVDNTVPELFIILEHFGGAIRRVGEMDTAFAGRDADYCLLIGGGHDTAEGLDQLSPTIRGVGEAMAPFATGHAYINYLDSDQMDDVPGFFGEERYRRLQHVKQKYDPENVFRFSNGIEPAG